MWLKFILNTVSEHYNPNVCLCPAHFTEDRFQNNESCAQMRCYNESYARQAMNRRRAIRNESILVRRSRWAALVVIHLKTMPHLFSLRRLILIRKGSKQSITSQSSLVRGSSATSGWPLHFLYSALVSADSFTAFQYPVHSSDLILLTLCTGMMQPLIIILDY